MHKANWWSPRQDQVAECHLCPRECRIADGKTGFCAARQNRRGELYSLVYGNPIAVHVDPIEKKPLYHFYPGSQILSIGTVGCNLECEFCQNWDIARGKVDQLRSRHYSPEQLVEAALQSESLGIAFTYNEPTIFGEYVLDIARLAREADLKTVMVTNGYISRAAIGDIFPFIDAANIDLKAFSQEFYSKYCHADLGHVLDAIIEIGRQGTFIELTTLLIPGLNDSPDLMRAEVNWILENLGADVPFHLSAFHPDYHMRDYRPTPKTTLDGARQLALEMGMKYVYEGNIAATHGNNTYCPNCGALLVERQWFSVSVNNVVGGRCRCGEAISIVNKI